MSPEDLIHKYPDRIPVSVEVSEGLYLDRNKYLVPRTMTVGEFNIVIRKRMNKLKPYEAIFLFVNKSTIPPTSSTFETLHREYSENNMLLHLKYTKENTFG